MGRSWAADEARMRTGKELILATRLYATDSTVRSWWYVLSTVALLGAAWAGTMGDWHLAGRLSCAVFSGLLLLRLFVIYHDQQHHAILPKSRVAESLMRVVGVLALSPSSVWRSSHGYHHKHNSKLRSAHIGSFPVMTRAEYLRSPRGVRFRYLFARHPLTILFGYVFIFLWGMCLYPFFNKPREHFDCLLAFLVHVAIGSGLGLAFGWPAVVVSTILPHFIASAVGAYLFYAQHNFPDVIFHDRAGWAYEKAALESSSYLECGPVTAWFTANIGYHHVHHLNSRIPFYRLPEAKAAIPELDTPRTTSLRPGDILGCLRLKLWDVEARKMITVRECLAGLRPGGV